MTDTKAAPSSAAATGASNGTLLASGSERPAFFAQLGKLSAIPEATVEAVRALTVIGDCYSVHNFCMFICTCVVFAFDCGRTVWA
jgi:hypothetical protein